jgi:glutamate 5-kinase
LQLKKTLETLWKNNVIPIANENDVMSDKELKFSDNDQLAMMIAINLGAQKILFGTNAPGLWDENKKVIPVIETFDARIFSLVRPNESTAGGLGGMATKLTYADMATKYGVEAIIFSGKTPQSILTSMNGETGTCCKPQGCQIPARKKWLAVSSLSLGKIFVDEGAAQAIKNRKSLLSVGAKKIKGAFEKNAVIQLCVPAQPDTPLAMAQAEMSSVDSKKSLTQKTSVVLAHADKIVLL